MRLSTNTPNSVENMSEDDNLDIDIEESDEDDSDTKQARNKDGTQFYSQAEKRAHHNALERKRRDHIKDSFTSLRDSVPSLQGEKVASRAQILKKAAEYIQFMRRKNNSHQQDIDDLKRQNSLLEAQSTSLLRTLERARSSGNFDGEMPANGGDMKSDSEEESSEGDDVPQNVRRNKKIKTNAY